MRPSQLQRAALEAGASPADVEAAVDGEAPRDSLVALLLEHEDRSLVLLQQELAPLKASQLQRRALAAGVSDASVDEALDGEDAKAALTALIIAQRDEAPAPQSGMPDAKDRPHFVGGTVGSTSSAAVSAPAPAVSAPSSAAVQSTAHVMLSYQWDHQTQVTRVYDMLTKLGVKCWMDIRGGMQSGDIYDDMASGISGACAVVCFMSQSYQMSENCMLECKFARQSGVPILPVMVEAGGWRATGWLGLLTAGSLWVRMSDETAFDENVHQLYSQIQTLVGSAVRSDLEEMSDAAVVTASEAKEELERLRDDLVTKADFQSTGAAVLSDPSQPATIPAGVPKLPARFQSTEQITELARLVLSTSARDMAMPRVGFWGMGGIGKTVTGAAIVRDDAVRLHFHAIIWLPLGQTPVVSKLQNLCHMQCTGKELSAELSSDEKKEALQQAMQGKRVLLCLDDLWEEEHELELNFVDASAGSKVLISTRMKVLLDGGHQVEVGLPSASDASRMLLAAADVDDRSHEPAGVREIVVLCGRLPLALGIAGRLAASLGLVGTEDWRDMIGVLKEELRANHSGGVQEGMIRASLRGLTGSAQEQANVKSVLLLFALVPEDTHCPLEVLLLMFNAVHPGSSASMMHLRKWLRVLIARSLVLGTVDRSSVHDLVLDFAVAQWTSQELCKGHCAVVEAFRALRPSDVHGRRRYDSTVIGEPTVAYICTEGGHHVSGAMYGGELPNIGWVQDFPADPLVMFAANALSVEKLTALARQADVDRDFWLAARYWSLLRRIATRHGDAALAYAQKSVDSIVRITEAPDPDALDDLTLQTVHSITTVFVIDAIHERLGVINDVLATDAAMRDPAVTAGMRLFLVLLLPQLPDWTGDVRPICQNIYDLVCMLKRTAASDPDPLTRSNCALLSMTYPCEELAVLSDGWHEDSWEELYGVEGEFFISANRMYSFDHHHEYLTSTVNADWSCILPPMALMYRWGHMSSIEAIVDERLSALRRCIDEPEDSEKEQMHTLLGPSLMINTLHATGFAYLHDKAAALLVDAGLTYSAADTTFVGHSLAWLRPVGDKSLNVHFNSTDSFIWHAKCAHVLVSTNLGVSAQQVLAELPSVEETIGFAMVYKNVGMPHATCSHAFNLFYPLAAASEKLGDYDKSLEYIDAGLSTDITRAGTQLPIARAVFTILRGRVLATAGRRVEAGAALEGAATASNGLGLWVTEALALLELKLCVLDPMGHSEHGSRRLGAALRKLKGPADKLNQLLKGGLDAAELMAMPPPDDSYEILYASVDSESADSGTALRQELSSLKLKALKQRARELGVSDKTLDDADDADDIRAAVVELIVDAATVRDSGGQSISGAKEEELQTQSPATLVLRQELQSLRLKELRARAKVEGVEEDALEDATDKDDPKQAVMELLLQHLRTDVLGSHDDEVLRSELEGLRLKELRARAKQADVDEDALEDATDSDDPKQAVIDLLLHRQSQPLAPASDRPHFGSSVSSLASATATVSSSAVDSKHVMLSYQWDHQAQVKHAYDRLTKLGVRCWMDIAGGMSSDIYESMANAVSNASVVVCFMSQQYQESENCMLELKFAKQSGVSMIPVMMERGGWRPGGWLGLITAGSLWTRLDESAFEEGVRQLHGQIQKVVGAAGLDDLEVTTESAASPSEAKEELERLRDDLVATADTSSSTALADPSQPATIPAGVPKLPARFHTTAQIEELTRLVLSTSARDMAMPRVGFWGMGGIGKTVTGAAIVRDDAVRLHFHAIIWLPLGQTPVVSKLQNLCHMQCTGKELSAELSSDEKKEALQQAMQGKRVLLCLDDLWEEEHELELNFVDASAGSKVLISTRMKVLLDGGHQVEVGLPSPADSARMLLSAAGVENSSGDRQPAGAREIVDLCGRLPLALGIAGRLAASLGLVGTDDWSGMIDVLKEELHESHSGGGTEEGIIRASLRGLKGSAQEQASVKSLLMMFAYVPEDTFCPLEVLLLMFKAVNEGSAVTMMHLRKWMRILVNRSLVLGTIDRPSVHDLVLDFAVAQHGKDELRHGHRAIVEAFRAARPADVHGRRRYDITYIGEPLNSYVCMEVGHHVASATRNSELPVEWLQDVPADTLTLSAASALGVKKLAAMARQADADRDYWLAARYWSALREVGRQVGGQGATLEYAQRSMDSIARMTDASDADARDDLLLQQAKQVMLVFQLDAIHERLSVIEKVLGTDAAVRDPASSAAIRAFLLFVLPQLSSWTGDITPICQSWFEQMMLLKKAAMQDPDPVQRLNCALMVSGCGDELMALSDGFSSDRWSDVYGRDAEFLINLERKYQYDAHHDFLAAALNCDWRCHCMNSLPLMYHFGDMVQVEDTFVDNGLRCLRRSMAEPEQLKEQMHTILGPIITVNVLHATGFNYLLDRVAPILIEAGLTWKAADETVGANSISWVRPLGDKTRNVHFNSTESFTWQAKCAHVLVSTNLGVSAQQVLAELPSVEDAISFSMTYENVAMPHNACSHGYNIFYPLAAASEKLGDYDKSLEYIDAGLSTDLLRAGTQLPIARAVFTILRGRVLATAGRRVEAGAALEGAVTASNGLGLWVTEALALLELKLCVLDPMGHSEHGSRRLGAALRKLKGPADKLNQLLKGGLDAAELMAMPLPDPSHTVVYDVQGKGAGEGAISDQLARLRAEYEGLKTMALHARAVSEGLENEKLDDALEDDRPKAALVALLLETHEAAFRSSVETRDEEAAAAQRREELRGLRVVELHKRCVAHPGVSDAMVDDAMESDAPKAALVELLAKGG